ncbi:MAG: helix-turn-helix transcriptional regulator [Armatimonadota bacterium]
MTEAPIDNAAAPRESQAGQVNREWSDLLRWRRDLRLSQDAVAQKIGVTQAAVSGWERCLYPPDIALIPLLATALGRTRDEVLLSMADVFCQK